MPPGKSNNSLQVERMSTRAQDVYSSLATKTYLVGSCTELLAYNRIGYLSKVFVSFLVFIHAKNILI
jgi:hypothetical protein